MMSLPKFSRYIVGVLLLISALVWAAGSETGRDTGVLGPDAYRTPLDQVIVTGHVPYWQRQTPRWDRPELEIPQQATPSRMQWLPKYTRDERDDYDGIRDTQNPQPRIKLFEFRF